MPRQPNRRPKIYQGDDGLYHCYVTVGTKPNGKLDRRHRQGKTATEVARKVDELLGQAQRGGGVPQKIETVEQWLTHWLENVIRPTRAWGTYASYKSLITTHVIPGIGAWRLDGHRRRLEPEHVEAMYETMRGTRRGKTGVSDPTVLKTHRMLRKSLKDAVRRGKASRNVCDLIDTPPARGKRIEAHTLTETQAIITAALDDLLAARWLLGMLLGPRQGETLGIRWHRVHLDPPGDESPWLELETQVQRRSWQHGCTDPVACAAARCRTEPCPPRWGHGCADESACKGRPHFCPARRRLPGCSRHQRPCPPPCRPGCTGHARHCPQRHSGGLVEVDLKTESSVRKLPLPPVVVELLRTHRARQQAQQQKIGKWAADGLVFATELGGPIDPKHDHAAWEDLLRRAGVRDSRLHAARHTAGTMLVASGTDTRIVQEILGHTQITTTQIYVDVAQDVKRQAVDRAVAALMDGNLTALLQRSSATGSVPS